MVELIKTWPVYNMLVQSKCELLAHPCQVQVVDMLEGYRVFETDQKNSPTICKNHFYSGTNANSTRYVTDSLTQVGMLGGYVQGCQGPLGTICNE